MIEVADAQDGTMTRVLGELLDLCDGLDNELIDYRTVSDRIREILDLEGLL